MKARIVLAVLLLMWLSGYSRATAYAATDTGGHWAAEIIDNSIGDGYVSGYPDGSFRPNNPVTRAEFVAMANNYMGFTPASITQFWDVLPGDWFYNDVGAALREGYVSGYPDGSFGPNTLITREMAAVIAANILHLSPNNEYATYFTDSQSLSWSRGDVGAAVKAKLITGYTNGEFRPFQPMTRAEAIVLLSGVSGKRYDSGLDTSYGYQSYYSNLDNYSSGYIPEDRLNYQSTNISTTTTQDKDGYFRIYNGGYGSDKETESFYGSIMYDPKYAGTVKNIYVSGDFELTSNIVSDSELILQDVTIKGKLIIDSISDVTLRNCEINSIEFRSDRSGAEIRAQAGTVVDETHVYRSVRLLQETSPGFRNVYFDDGLRQRDLVTISGDTNYIFVNGNKARLVIEKGKIGTIEIASEGEKCDIEVRYGSAVDFMDVKGSCYVHGNGTITLARITASDAEFDLKPRNVSGTKDPIYTPGATDGDSISESNTYRVVITVALSGVPQSGVNVALGSLGTSLTDGSGEATFSGIPNGAYNCVVYSYGAPSQTFQVSVNGRDVYMDIEYDARPKYDVIVDVRLNGIPVQGAIVRLGSHQSVTDVNGRVAFSEIVAGVYNCTASFIDSSGYTWNGDAIVDVTNMNVSKTIDLF